MYDIKWLPLHFLGGWTLKDNQTILYLVIVGGVFEIWAFFEVGKRFQKNQEIIRHSVDKRFPKFGIFLSGKYVYAIMIYY